MGHIRATYFKATSKKTHHVKKEESIQENVEDYSSDPLFSNSIACV